MDKGPPVVEFVVMIRVRATAWFNTGRGGDVFINAGRYTPAGINGDHHDHCAKKSLGPSVGKLCAFALFEV